MTNRPEPSVTAAPSISGDTSVHAPQERRSHGLVRNLFRLFMLLCLGLLPMMTTPSIILVATTSLIFSLLALSLNVLMGTTGLVSFGHAAFFGAGAYSLAYLVSEFGFDPLLALLIAPLVAALVATAAGLIALRVRNIYFSLITLGIAQLLYSNTLAWPHLTGGSDGITGRFAPRLLLASPHLFYWFVLAMAVVCALFLFLATHSPYGDKLRAIRENRRRAECIGIPVKAYEYSAFVVAALFAGIAGGLFAMFQLQAYPRTLHWTMSAEPMIMGLLGGMNAFLGPVVGAFTLTFLRDIIGQATVYWDIVLGVLVVLASLLMPHGLVGAFRQLGEKLAAQVGFDLQPQVQASPPAAPVEPTANDISCSRRTFEKDDPILSVGGLHKTFNLLHVTRDVSFSVQRGSVHAIIGSNGAGKSTLFNLISGIYKPDKGHILFDGKPINGMSSWRLARLGIGRSFQQANLFWDLTVWDNLCLAATASFGIVSRPFGSNSSLVTKRAAEVADLLSITHLLHYKAVELSHGDQRTLELAMVITSGSRLLLLDEPTAGLSPSETRSVVGNIIRLAALHNLTVVVVEHDMEVVFNIADVVTVLSEGAIIAHGKPEEIRANSIVQRAYLGSHHDEAVEGQGYKQ